MYEINWSVEGVMRCKWREKEKRRAQRRGGKMKTATEAIQKLSYLICMSDVSIEDRTLMLGELRHIEGKVKEYEKSLRNLQKGQRKL